MDQIKLIKYTANKSWKCSRHGEMGGNSLTNLRVRDDFSTRTIMKWGGKSTWTESFHLPYTGQTIPWQQCIS